MAISKCSGPERASHSIAVAHQRCHGETIFRTSLTNHPVSLNEGHPCSHSCRAVISWGARAVSESPPLRHMLRLREPRGESRARFARAPAQKRLSAPAQQGTRTSL